jgi:hypothetical protein
MSIPFTLEQFLDVFRRYNQAVWPAQAVLIVLAVVAVVAAVSGGPRASRLVSGIVAVLWLWAGAAYHLTFFRDINPIASVFAIAFIIEAVAFAWLGVVRGSLSFDARPGWSGLIGGSIIAYALIAYPLVGVALGHRLPSAPTFGVPCPTTIFTFGLIVWMVPPRSRAIVFIPAVWSLVALSAAVDLGMWEDLGLTVAAGLAIATVVWPSRKPFPSLRPSS